MKTGKNLIAVGYKPNSKFKSALEHINANNLNDSEIVIYMDSIQDVHISLHEKPVEYFKNIRAENPDEEQNIVNTFKDMDSIMVTPTVVNGCIMPDACPTGPGQIPVGGVVVARNAIHPSWHSADICCSVMMSNLGYTNPKTALDFAHQVTHFGPGGRDKPGILPESLIEEIMNNPFLNSEKSLELAKTHLGTQGDGNHFLFIGVSKSNGKTFMVTHHGSRGFGALLYKKGMECAEKFRKKISPATSPKNAWIPYDTIEGEQYWQALQIVRKWTKFNHASIHGSTMQTLELPRRTQFWNEHNFVFKVDDLFYHAKGATPLDDKFMPDSFQGLRLIPLNMGQPILVVKGATTLNNLGFAPHGAGRNISRKQHKLNHQDKTIEQLFAEETAGLDVRFFSKNIDISELPSAYKNASSVMEQINEFALGEIVDVIKPFGCIMAGDWEKNASWKNKKKK